jgi:succinate dehydrogenase flavin-adding protein (antitoxin of CptAB toxin-antitoxin module)
MKIEMDAVVNEYVLQTLETMSELDKPPYTCKREVVTILKAMMNSNLINHRYNATRGIDEFRATRRLTWQWRRDFLEVAAIVAPTETIIVEIGEDRRTFTEKLLGAEDRGPPRHN